MLIGRPSRPASIRLGILAIACAALGLLSACGGERGRAARKEARAIVLITVDGMIAEELSVYGGPQPTPNLQALASAGTAYPDVWTVTPMTRPAVATYLTGLTPDRHGVRDDLLTSLDTDVPTLAGVLTARGYRTAAFPDSSFLSRESGLLRDFSITDDPRPPISGPLHWMPELKVSRRLPSDLKSWLETLPPDARYFAWVHLSFPMISQLKGFAAPPDLPVPEGQDDPARPFRERAVWANAVREIDDAVGAIVQALSSRGDLNDAAVLVAGTMGDLRGGANDPPGPGMSLDARALRVPLIARWPGGASAPVPMGGARWATDVAVTLARLAGAELPTTEGVDLADDVPAERTLFAWSWATTDQMGWEPLRAARRGDRVISLGEGAPAPPEGDDLLAMLRGRGEPPMRRVDVEAVRPVLERRGLRLAALPIEGRPFGPLSARREVAQAVWQARWATLIGQDDDAFVAYDRALALDDQNFSALVAAGQLRFLRREEQPALQRLVPGVERYPSSPQALHWYAHTIWLNSWQDGALLVEAILPSLPADPDLLYDLACARSLGGDMDGSAEFLRRSIEAGFRQWEHMETDADLRALRESGRFAAVLRPFRQ